MRSIRRIRSETLAAGLAAALALAVVLAVPAGAEPRPALSSTLDVAITGGPSSGPLPLTVSLLADVSGGIAPYNYTWSFGDGSADAYGPSVTHEFLLKGAFNVTVSAVDSYGEPGNATLSIDVLPAILAASLTASPSSVAAFSAAFLEANASGGVPPYSYAWSGLPSGCSGGNFASLRCVPTETGGFTVTVNVSDSTGRDVTADVGLVVTPGTCPSPCSVSSGSSGAIPLWELTVFLIVAAVAGGLIGIVARPWLRRRR